MLKRKYLLISLGFLLAAPAISVAGPGTLSPMTKEQITTAFSDKTIKTISAATLDGTVISDSFMGYFSKDGKSTGRFAKKPNNEPQNDTGTWRVDDNGQFCFKWDHWNKAQDKCVTLYELNNSYLVVNQNNGFESLILKKEMTSGNNMSTMNNKL